MYESHDEQGREREKQPVGATDATSGNLQQGVGDHAE